MMDAVVAVTRKYNIKMMVLLAPHMVDGTGMCGACHVEVGALRCFVCIHGLEFDGLKLNWDSFKARYKQHTMSQEHSKEVLKTESKCRVRPATERVPMCEQLGMVLQENWEEATPGYMKAMAEVKRCIQCHNPACVTSTRSQGLLPREDDHPRIHQADRECQLRFCIGNHQVHEPYVGCLWARLPQRGPVREDMRFLK